MSDLLRAQLSALRSQLDVMHATIDAIVISLNGQPVLPQVQPGGCPQCGAPEDKQVDAGTLATPGLKKCLVCQGEY